MLKKLSHAAHNCYWQKYSFKEYLYKLPQFYSHHVTTCLTTWSFRDIRELHEIEPNIYNNIVACRINIKCANGYANRCVSMKEGQQYASA